MASITVIAAERYTQLESNIKKEKELADKLGVSLTEVPIDHWSIKSDDIIRHWAISRGISNLLDLIAAQQREIEKLRADIESMKPAPKGKR
jgi:predicted metalloenzyme YecM